MTSVRTLPRERRRDPRFVLPGSVRLVRQEPLASLEGALCDVSAGGVKLRGAASGPIAPGDVVDVEVTVRDLSDPNRPPVINLRGHGAVVRSVEGEEEGEVAVRLDGPLGFREYFSQVRVF
jgi:hypothetical protein